MINILEFFEELCDGFTDIYGNKLMIGDKVRYLNLDGSKSDDSFYIRDFIKFGQPRTGSSINREFAAINRTDFYTVCGAYSSVPLSQCFKIS